MTDDFGAPIKHAILIRAEPEKVYDALATAEGLDGWFTEGSEVDARPGGHICFRWRNWGVDKVNTEATGPVVKADRPKRFVFQWHGDNKEYYTTVDIKLEPTEEGTVVRLEEYGYQDTPGGRVSILDCATGWGEALTLVKFYVEHGLRY